MKHCFQVNADTYGVNWHEEFVGLILEMNCHQWLIMNRDLTIGPVCPGIGSRNWELKCETYVTIFLVPYNLRTELASINLVGG
jgi:hypothetical protein